MEPKEDETYIGKMTLDEYDKLTFKTKRLGVSAFEEKDKFFPNYKNKLYDVYVNKKEKIAKAATDLLIVKHWKEYKQNQLKGKDRKDW